MKHTFRLLAPFLVAAGMVVALAGHAQAADYTQTRLMDDQVFNNSGSLSQSQISAFLNGQPGAYTKLASASPCLSGYKNINFHWDGTKWHYGSDSDWNTAWGAAQIPASAIIAQAAQLWGINPEVIIATLEKEESLVSGSSCDPWRYNSAMGYGCPDSGGCIPRYVGFSKQVLWGSYQLEFGLQRSYGNTSWDDDGTIVYSGYMTAGNRARCAGCTVNFYDGYAPIDGQSIFMENGATASLYSYTPHLGNSTPVNFERWFGSAVIINSSIVLSKGLTLSSTSSAYINDTVTGSYEISNTAAFDVNAGGFGVCARINGQNYDFGFIDHQAIPANGKVTISYSKHLDITGNLSLFLCAYNEALGGWVSNRYPYDSTNSLARQATVQVLENPVITTGISLSPASPAIGQAATATLSIHNYSNNPVAIGSMIIAARDPLGNNADFAEDANISIPAGATYTYSKTRTFAVVGPYSMFIVNWRGAGYDTGYPKSASGSVVRQASVTVIDNPVIVTSIGLSPASPAIGQPITATLSIRNAGSSAINIGSLVIAARDSSGRNVDFGIDNDVTIPPNGGTYTYSKTQTFTSPGNYSLFIAHWDKVWDTNYPKSADGSVVRQTGVTVLDNPLVTAGISLSPTNPSMGQAVVATVAIHNASASAVNIGLFVVAVRDPFGNNLDFAPDQPVTIPASSTYTYTKSQTFTTPGNYSMFLANLRGTTWDRNYPASANSSIVRNLSYPSIDREQENRHYFASL